MSPICNLLLSNMQQDHVISSQARLHATPSLEEVGLCTNEQVGHAAQAMVTPTVVNMAPSKKRKGAPKAASGAKKSKATGKKPRPVEALRTAFRKLIAGMLCRRHTSVLCKTLPSRLHCVVVTLTLRNRKPSYLQLVS